MNIKSIYGISNLRKCELNMVCPLLISGHSAGSISILTLGVGSVRVFTSSIILMNTDDNQGDNNFDNGNGEQHNNEDRVNDDNDQGNNNRFGNDGGGNPEIEALRLENQRLSAQNAELEAIYADMRARDGNALELRENQDVFTIFDIPFDDMGIITDTHSLVAEFRRDFEVHVNIHKRYIVADASLSHHKDTKERGELQRSTELFIRVHISRELEKVLVYAVFKSLCNPRPIAFKYLKEIELAMMSNSKMLASPMFTMNPKAKYPVAKAIYGISHGLNDMHHFCPTDWTEVTINCQYDSRIGGSVQGFVITLTPRAGEVVFPSIVFNSSLKVFDLQDNPPLNSTFDAETMFEKSSHVGCMLNMYTLTGRCNYEYTNETITERIGISTKDQEGKIAYASGFKIASNFTEGMDVVPLDIPLMDIITPLFMLDRVEGGLVSDIVKYVGTCIYHHTNYMTKQATNSQVVKIDMEVTIRRQIKNEDLIPLFRSYVEDGRIIPLSPIQFLFYLSDVDLALWGEYIMYSSLINIRMNPSLISCMPRTAIINKTNFVKYARSRDWLCTIKYESTGSVKHSLGRYYKISFRAFIQEILARTVIRGEFPDYMHPISAGLWVGSGGASRPIIPAHINRVFCKFGMSDKHDIMEEYISRISMSHPSIKIPGFIKSRTRLSEHFINILDVFVPSSDITIEMESMIDEDCESFSFDDPIDVDISNDSDHGDDNAKSKSKQNSTAQSNGN